jgi:hypothetical protein
LNTEHQGIPQGIPDMLHACHETTPKCGYLRLFLVDPYCDSARLVEPILETSACCRKARKGLPKLICVARGVGCEGGGGGGTLDSAGTLSSSRRTGRSRDSARLGIVCGSRVAGPRSAPRTTGRVVEVVKVMMFDEAPRPAAAAARTELMAL